MRGIVALLDQYIEQAYEVNVMNSTINMLKNGLYVPTLKYTYDSMKHELPSKIKQSHQAAGIFLNAVHVLNPEEKEKLAVMLMEKAAQAEQVMNELRTRLEGIIARITEQNGVVPNIVDGVIPMVSANRNIEDDELESLYRDVFQQKEKVEFAFNIYNNYSAYLGFSRNQSRSM